MGAFKRQLEKDFIACLKEINSKIKGDMIPDCNDYMLLFAKFIGVSKMYNWREVEDMIKKVVND
jgi:hypothetical protein